MLGFIRLVGMGLIFLTIIYVCLSLYSRAVRRGKLRKKWYDGPQKVDRETFVQRGLEKYDGSIRRKLIWGVYIVPIVAFVAIIYLTNHN